MEKISQKKVNDNLRIKFMKIVRESLEQLDEEILTTGSNEFAIPCIDENGEDSFVVIKFSVPTGSRDGEGYDGYSMAEDYRMKCEAQAQKKAEAAEKKAAKIAKDKAAREAKAKAKAEK